MEKLLRGMAILILDLIALLLVWSKGLITDQWEMLGFMIVVTIALVYGANDVLKGVDELFPPA